MHPCGSYIMSNNEYDECDDERERDDADDEFDYELPYSYKIYFKAMQAKMVELYVNLIDEIKEYKGEMENLRAEYKHETTNTQSYKRVNESTKLRASKLYDSAYSNLDYVHNQFKQTMRPYLIELLRIRDHYIKLAEDEDPDIIAKAKKPELVKSYKSVHGGDAMRLCQISIKVQHDYISTVTRIKKLFTII